MWIFFDFPLLFVLQEFISGYVLFVFNFQIKYLKNLALASILFCNRELFTEFPIPGPAHSPPPSCIASPAKDQPGRRVEPVAGFSPRALLPLQFSLQFPPRQQGPPHTELQGLQPVKRARGGERKII